VEQLEPRVLLSVGLPETGLVDAPPEELKPQAVLSGTIDGEGTWLVPDALSSTDIVDSSAARRAPLRVVERDRLEPNNSRRRATNLGPVEGVTEIPALTIHATRPGRSERDWFRFETLDTGAETDYVEIEFAHSDGDLNMILYDQFGRRLARATSKTDNERISLDGRPAGVYYAKVFGRRGATAPYDLAIVAPETARGDALEPNDSPDTATDLQQLAGETSLTDLSIHANADGTPNDDWFQFETQAVGDSTDYVEIQFSHYEGDLDMVLYDASGEPVAWSVSVSDNERVSLEGLSAGAYYAHVYGYWDATAAYDLVIEAPEEAAVGDAFEPNDTPAAATDLGPVEGVTSLTELSIHAGADGTPNDDWFQFETQAFGDSTDYVEIQFSHGEGDLDMTLCDASGQEVDWAMSVSDNELISLEGLPAGIYYSHVYGYGDATAAYDLVIEAPLGCADPCPDPTPDPGLAQWTVLVYGGGDNDLEANLIEDVNEMEAATLPAGMQVGVLMDRASGYDSSNGNWTDTRVGVIQHGDNSTSIVTPLESWGERNTGDPDTLIDFLNWGMATLPAENYFLVLWDHGDGIYGAVWDDSPNDHLTITEMGQALAAAPDHIDVLGFDACLMASTEVMYQLSSYTDYFVASEETEGLDGWDYTDLFGDLAGLSSLTPEELARAVVTSSSDDPAIDTLSAVHAEPSGVATSVAGFVDVALAQASSSDWSAVASARDSATTYDDPDFRDLGEFMAGVSSSVANAAIAGAADTVLRELDAIVLQNYNSSSESGRGLSIYFNRGGDSVYSGYSQLQFDGATDWGDFLVALGQNGRSASASGGRSSTARPDTRTALGSSATTAADTPYTAETLDQSAWATGWDQSPTWDAASEDPVGDAGDLSENAQAAKLATYEIGSHLQSAGLLANASGQSDTLLVPHGEQAESRYVRSNAPAGHSLRQSSLSSTLRPGRDFLTATAQPIISQILGDTLTHSLIGASSDHYEVRVSPV